MCEKDQNFHWGYDLFRDPFAPIGYYGPPHGYGDGNYCDLHYARDASHLDETHLHSSALTYDLYNPSVGIYHPGSENICNLTRKIFVPSAFPPNAFGVVQEMLVSMTMTQSI